MRRREFLKSVVTALASSVLGWISGRPIGAAERAATWSRTVRLIGPVTIPAGAVQEFDPNVTTTVEIDCGGPNEGLIVRGILRMRPASPAVVHTLRFVNVSESGFVGGGDVPKPTDPGLWIMDRGRLDAVGRRRLAWARTTRGLRAGATRATLDADPRGWQVGDEILVTATLPPNMADLSDKAFTTANDVRHVHQVSGRRVTLDSGLTFEHPSAPVSPERVMTPEVCNLTRNVKIEGTPDGRSHVFIRSMVPQHISQVEFRHLGPPAKLGRYAMHIHRSDDGTRGSLIEGCVARDIGTWGFVGHRSNGITFRDCIAYKVADRPFGWDLVTESNAPDKADFTSNDLTYKRCVAVDCPLDKDRAFAFAMQLGTGNRCIGCVAVGVNGGDSASGFFWPTHNFADWVFEDNVAHNCNVGAFFWVNNDMIPEPLRNFVAYRNKNFGVELGSYGNNYVFEHNLLFGNGMAQVLHHTQAKTLIEWRRCRFEAELVGQRGFQTTDHRIIHSAPRVIDSHVKTLSGACFEFYADGDPEKLDIVNTVFDGPNELYLGDKVGADSIVRVQIEGDPNPDLLDGTFVAVPAAAPKGTLIPAWNARRVDIERFYE